MTYRTRMRLVAATLLLASCGNPKDASKDNFRAALQGWFDQHGECVTIGDMPAKIPADSPLRAKAAYEAMTMAGLLTMESKREEQPAIMGHSRTYDILLYRPTDEGAKVIRKAANTFLGRYELCYARRDVTDVTSWTEPGDIMGLHVSQVRYRYRLNDIAPWASAPAMRAAFPKIAAALDKPEGEDKASLVLTNEGWRHEKSLSQ